MTLLGALIEVLPDNIQQVAPLFTHIKFCHMKQPPEMHNEKVVCIVYG